MKHFLLISLIPAFSYWPGPFKTNSGCPIPSSMGIDSAIVKEFMNKEWYIDSLADCVNGQTSVTEFFMTRFSNGQNTKFKWKYIQFYEDCKINEYGIPGTWTFDKEFFHINLKTDPVRKEDPILNGAVSLLKKTDSTLVFWKNMSRDYKWIRIYYYSILK